MSERHAAIRVRHELKRRSLCVSTVERLTSTMVRVVLEGPELEGFRSQGFDDHVKVFFPIDGQIEPVLPILGADGPVYPIGATPSPMRDFTPRRYDERSGRLTIDFALHDHGPAAIWSRSAKPGDRLAVAGPRGSFIPAADFDWYLLAGDESALPAIGRRLEEMAAGTTAIVVAAVAAPEEELIFETAANVRVVWVHRPLSEAAVPERLVTPLLTLDLPSGDGHGWIAAESSVAKAARMALIERGMPKIWIKASGYWRSGAQAVHEHHDE